MLKVGIVGATGYAGEELIRILLKHPKVKINYLAAKIKQPQRIDKIFPSLRNRISLICENLDMVKASKLCDLVFLALPHTVSMKVAAYFLNKGIKVIDLSADYRLKDASTYREWYGVGHIDKKNLKKAVYGLPEIYRDKIKKAKLVANPGCYPTGAILSIAPLAKKKIIAKRAIIIDSKSGFSGAGRKEPESQFLSQLKGNFKAYKVDMHQHSPEIEQELKKIAGKIINLIFVPHLLPVERGILSSIYIKLKSKQETGKLISLYREYYKNEPFIRIKKNGAFPQLKDVVGTNYCDIGIKASLENDYLIVVSAIDNLVKGAAGQAVQNMNIISNFKETQGLL